MCHIPVSDGDGSVACSVVLLFFGSSLQFQPVMLHSGFNAEVGSSEAALYGKVPGKV